MAKLKGAGAAKVEPTAALVEADAAKPKQQKKKRKLKEDQQVTGSNKAQKVGSATKDSEFDRIFGAAGSPVHGGRSDLRRNNDSSSTPTNRNKARKPAKSPEPKPVNDSPITRGSPSTDGIPFDVVAVQNFLAAEKLVGTVLRLQSVFVELSAKSQVMAQEFEKLREQYLTQTTELAKLNQTLFELSKKLRKT